MRHCPLSYLPVEGRYDLTALHRLHPRLADLADLPYTTAMLLEESRQRADKLSIQGVQPKLSARLKPKEQRFELVDQHGQFILKPQNLNYRALPENEDLTMHLAALCGLEVPDHGLIYGEDGQLTYWVRRFDRTGRDQKLPLEDFAQLLSESRDTKYRSSMEKVAGVIEQFCTFPPVEKARLLRLVLFNYLCGNEDHHLKNFSLLVQAPVVRLSPCYDLLNSTLVMGKKQPEELALPLRGKKRKLKREDLLGYYAQEVLQVREGMVETILRELAAGLVQWPDWLERSFLPPELQERYSDLVHQRSRVLGFVSFEVDPTGVETLDRLRLQTGSGGHQSFWKTLLRQRSGGRFCLTADQAEQVTERSKGSGGWQSAYRLLADKVATLR